MLASQLFTYIAYYLVTLLTYYTLSTISYYFYLKLLLYIADIDVDIRLSALIRYDKLSILLLSLLAILDTWLLGYLVVCWILDIDVISYTRFCILLLCYFAICILAYCYLSDVTYHTIKLLTLSIYPMPKATCILLSLHKLYVNL